MPPTRREFALETAAAMLLPVIAVARHGRSNGFIPQPASVPTFSPAAGTYATAQNVTISSATPSATIYYTLDGSTPTLGSPIYSGPVLVNVTETLNAIAISSVSTQSPVGSAAYTITTAAAATPTFSPPGGTYATSQSVSISCATSGSTIYYTTDGSTPTTSSTVYSGAITVSASETINAIATATGYVQSNVGSAAYAIGVTGFYPAGHYTPAKMPLSLVYPRPDTETATYARHRKAYWDGTNAVEYQVPVGVQFGAPPFVFQLLAGPPGMTIGATVWQSGWTFAQAIAANYGVVLWTPQGNISSSWSGTVTVRVYSQDYQTDATQYVDVSWSLATSSSLSDFIFVDPVNGLDTNNGAYSTPLQTFEPIYGKPDTLLATSAATASGNVLTFASTTGVATGQLVIGTNLPSNAAISSFTSTTITLNVNVTGGGVASGAQIICAYPSPNVAFAGAIVHLKGGTYPLYYKYNSLGNGPCLDSADNPVSIVGIPGQTVTFDITNSFYSAFAFSAASDVFISGITFTGAATGQPFASTDFDYFKNGHYTNSRFVLFNISCPNVYAGTAPISNSSIIWNQDSSSSGIYKQYYYLRNVSESNRPNPGGTDNNFGICDIYATQYGLIELCSCPGNAGEAGYYLKATSLDWTLRFCDSLNSPSAYGLGAQINLPLYTANIEVCYCSFLCTGNYGAQINFNYQATGSVWVYRCNFTGYIDINVPVMSLATTAATSTGNVLTFSGTTGGSHSVSIGATVAGTNIPSGTTVLSMTATTVTLSNNVTGTGVANSATITFYQGPFDTENNAIQYPAGSQPIMISRATGALPSNVTNGGSTACQGTSGILDSNNNLTAAYSSYVGTVGAQIA